MNQYGTNRFMPRKNLKIEKDLFNLFLGILTIFCSKRGTKRFTAGEISSARQRQFSAANRFMPRFEWFLELIIILGWTFWITCKNKRIGVNSKPKPKHNYHLFPKGVFSLHCGSPWLEWLSFPCFIVFGILPPYEPWCLFPKGEVP